MLATVPGYDRFDVPLFIALLLLSLLSAYILMRRKSEGQITSRVVFTLVLTSMLILVQSTGGFFSPFLFVIYLSVVSLCLLYSFLPGGLFLLSISFVFFGYFDHTSGVTDLIRLAALYTSLPIASLFAKEFLKLKESEREIMILKEERLAYESELERLRKNKLVWNDVLLRQSLATARNFALYWDSNSHGLPPRLQRDLKRMGKKLDEAIADIKKFEEKSLDESYR